MGKLGERHAQTRFNLLPALLFLCRKQAGTFADINLADQMRQLPLDLEQHTQLRQTVEQLQGFLEQFGIALVEVGGELLAQFTLCWRRNCGDDMSPTDQWAVFGLQACVVPGALDPQPQRQRSDLRGARVDFHGVDVVFYDQARHVV